MQPRHSTSLPAALFLGALLATAGGAHAASCKGGASSTIKLKGVVKKKATYDYEALKNFRLDPNTEYTPTTLTVSFNTSQGPVTATYTGIPLIDLLTAAEVKLQKKQKNDILRKYVVAHATDCYEVVIALGEILSNFEDKKVLVAYDDGEGQPLGEDGVARLIVPDDKAGGRSVFNLSRLTVRSAPR